ncbi:monooxygenase [Blastomyces dermatitidis ER-3]|uniref:Flavin-binding monooxygenase n=2 Tax=Ajellomyces dermatitidis TaxID=5039 RepID=F2T383_AJEDA|nr:monooxygenase [Blastomyces dermatitidis ER-3]EEQ87527.2 monooxygenase [Blastomyces dermatitidis ER-3]EGE77885.1 flavin-binding monooxygenase [Blastomyces dermatitidis ATCC 18188]
MVSDKCYPQKEVGNNNYTEAAVVIIGAGISGMCTAISLLNNNIHNFVILEKSGGLGGTWRDNKYPGCCCDINSHLYSYSFEQNPSWTRLYPGQEEILRYLHTVAEKYQLFRFIRFNSAVEEARWDDKTRKWRTAIKVAGESKDAEFADQYTLTSDFLVSAVGQLNSPAYPSIPGIEGFQGKIIHSARWDWTYDLKGKRVGIIGNGATAAQIIPVIAPDVAQLTVFQRTPNWVVPRLDTAIPKPIRALFQYFPPSLWKLRSWMMDLREDFHGAIADQDSKYATHARTASLELMKKQLPNRPELWEKLVPDYPVGCKRVIISDDYFPTFLRDNVTLETSPITQITKNGIKVDGAEHEFDVIVLATGFRTVEFMHPIQVYGINGRALSDIWSDGACALYGITVESLPNFGMLYGPNTNLGHNSIILMIEAQTKYIQAMINAVLKARQVGESLTILPDPKRVDAFNDELQSTLETTSFAHPSCRSWYKRADGKVTNNWSGTVVQYQKILSRVNWADFILDGYGAQQLRVRQKKTYVGRVREESLFTYRTWLVTMIGLLGTWVLLARRGSLVLVKLRALII